jgi:hypothetical protein
MPAPNTAFDFMAQVALPQHIWNECWEWTGQTVRGGYGRVGWRGRKVLAHRLSYELYVGHVPEGMHVCHSCDNPRCVRPSHLFVGTRQDNIDDMVRKGRQNTGGWRTGGERNAMAKLDWAAVVEIRGKYEPRTYSLSRLAREYGVTVATIHDVVRGRSWRNGPTEAA